MEIKQWIWSSVDDARLAETVLSYIRAGNTQLQAFEDVANALGRTSAACGFRWNSKVRQQFKNSIKEAKLDRNRNKQQKPDVVSTSNNKDSGLDMRDVLKFLRQLKEGYTELEVKIKMLKKELDVKSREILLLKEKNIELSSKNSFDQGINEDYQALLKIIDRARHISLDTNSRICLDPQVGSNKVAT
ncbi:RsfA family transcriptional regulator [Paenibacillus sp. FSL P4-0288]|uniref:RsfA family transcriptional regulator n=1 Tax=Paenibacillus sp. FSL P4-0288 TaxID=2921633 RepID=UPI0030F6C4FC